MPTAAELWWAKYRRRVERRDARGNVIWTHGEPIGMLHRLLLEVLSNTPDLIFRFPRDELPMVKEPNPWHSSPPDPELIEEGKLAIFDKIGETLGIGPYPRRGGDA